METSNSNNVFAFDQLVANESTTVCEFSDSDQAAALRKGINKLHPDDVAHISSFRRRTGIILGILYVVVLVCGIISIKGEEEGYSKEVHSKDLRGFAIFGPLAALFLRYIICKAYVHDAHTKQCPSCARLWAKKHEKSVLIGQSEGYDTVVRYDVHTNSRGEEVGRTRRQEQVHMVYQTHRNHYKCSFCSHQWTDVSRRSFEG